MNRRDLVISSLTATGAALAGSAFSSKVAFAATSPNAKLLETTSKCIATGLSCVAHCDEQLGNGNKSMAGCHATVTDMLAACEALQKLASRNSKHTAAFAKACAAVCADCAKACEAHAQHMETCKACMEACKECEKACNAAA